LIIRTLVFTRFFARDRSGLQAQLHDEYIKLSKKIKLIVVGYKFETEPNKNLFYVHISRPLKQPFISTIYNIINYSIVTIKVRKEFDVIFTRTMNINYLVPAIIAKLFFKKKFVIWISGSFRTQKTIKQLFERYIIKIAFGVADSIGTTSNHVINDIENNLVKINRKKVFFLNTAIDVSSFKPLHKENLDNVLLTVCAVYPIKGIENIIESIPFVKDQIPDVKLKVVGNYFDKKYLLRLKEQIHKLRCEDSVEFVGPIPHTDLVNWYNSAKIFILTSKTETLPTVIQEAMACGKPVISTPVGSVPEIITDGINGFILSENKPKILAKKIIFLLKDNIVREKIGLAARKTIEEKFSGDIFVNGIINQFNKLIHDV